MPEPKLRSLTKDQALKELRQLENSSEYSVEYLEERAEEWNLNGKEAAIWQRISELRWLTKE